jgi:hypothetical protein
LLDPSRTLKAEATGEWVSGDKAPRVCDAQRLLLCCSVAYEKQHDESADYQAEKDRELGSVYS